VLVLVIVLVVVVAIVAALVILKPKLAFSPEAAVLGLAGLSADDGLGTKDIAAAIGDDEAGTRRVLEKLAQSGHIELIPGTGSRWRLTGAYRSMIEPVDLQTRRR
jgi:hypothetical protein